MTLDNSKAIVLKVATLDTHLHCLTNPVNLKMEWIDDRFRMRGHPNESLAFLDRPEVTDFRRISVDKIWTPDLSVEYYS